MQHTHSYAALHAKDMRLPVPPCPSQDPTKCVNNAAAYASYQAAIGQPAAFLFVPEALWNAVYTARVAPCTKRSRDQTPGSASGYGADFRSGDTYWGYSSQGSSPDQKTRQQQQEEWRERMRQRRQQWEEQRQQREEQRRQEQEQRKRQRREAAGGAASGSGCWGSTPSRNGPDGMSVADLCAEQPAEQQLPLAELQAFVENQVGAALAWHFSSSSCVSNIISLFSKSTPEQVTHTPTSPQCSLQP